MKQLIDWNFASVWNNSLETYGERPYQARDYMYASELGGSYIDRFLKMLGTKPTNPPNNRSLRKFQAGHIWEWIVGFVLMRAGILHQKQVRTETNLSGCIRVSGRLDFIAGGVPDYERAKYEVSHLGLPEFIEYATQKIIAHLAQTYEGKELLMNVTEIKSVSSFVMERAIRTKKANGNHLLQNYHYLLGTNEEKVDYAFGRVVYVCRDDCRIMEFPVYKPSPHIYAEYEKDVRTFTDYFVMKELPPKEPLLIFDEDACKFSKNWRVEYSPYLTKIYKFKTPKEYAEAFGKTANSWNAVMKRCVDGKNMTALNKQRIAEAKKLFPEWDRYVLMARESGVLEMVEEEV